MNNMLSVVEAYFEVKGWPYDRHDELPVLRLEYEGDNGSWYLYARVREDLDQFIFLSVLEEKVPAKQHRKMAEFLTRANFGLNIGNFEMDFDDGEIRFRTSLDVTGTRLTEALVDPLVKASLVTMDDYLPGIQAVLNGEDPAKAIAKIQEEQDDDDEEYDLVL